MSLRLSGIVIACGLAAACTTYETTRTVMVPAPTTVAVTPIATDDACTLYGYTPGTYDYRLCTEREADARRRGRVASGYAEARLVADSQDACMSYGLPRGSDRYDRCVQREVAYRRPM